MDTNVIVLLKQFLPLLIPILIIELVLFVVALVDIIRRKKTNGPKWLWVLILFIQIIGPIVYFIVGRKDEE
jgi:hypothetical protein